MNFDAYLIPKAKKEINSRCIVDLNGKGTSLENNSRIL